MHLLPIVLITDLLDGADKTDGGLGDGGFVHLLPIVLITDLLDGADITDSELGN
jgi:hypothetical protein